jgi:hypothetical protein
MTRAARWLWIAGVPCAIGCARHESPPKPLAAPSAPPSASQAEPAPVDEWASETKERDRECTTTVNAPIDLVRRALTDYERYATMLPNFGRSHVLRRTADSADVYLQVPILRGAANLWGVVRFVGPVVRADAEQIEGNFQHEGNVSAFHCLWTYRKTDEARTELHLGLLVLPKIPLPESVIESELTSACRDAVQGVKSYVEARAAPPPQP